MQALAVQANPGEAALPALIAATGRRGARRVVEFFTVDIRNPNTRATYARATGEFLRWCERHGITKLQDVQPVHVATYVEQLQRGAQRPRSSNIWRVFGCCSIGS